MTGSSGVQPITEKFLGEGDLFGLKFNQGTVFLEVDSFEQVKYSPYSELGNIPSGTNLSFQRLNDPDGDDILYLESDQQKVIHAAIGQTPAVVRRYTNYPEGSNRLRKLDNLGTPVPGDDYGYVDGEDSPYEMPTEAEELWIPPKTHLDFAFDNPDGEDHLPILNIFMRVYRVKTLDPDSNQDRNAIKGIVNPTSPMPTVPAGGPDFQIDFELRDAWNTEPVSTNRIQRIKRGGN